MKYHGPVERLKNCSRCPGTCVDSRVRGASKIQDPQDACFGPLEDSSLGAQILKTYNERKYVTKRSFEEEICNKKEL